MYGPWKLLFLSLLLPTVGGACDCLATHIPLEEALCTAKETDTQVLTVTLLRHLEGNVAEVRVDEVLMGESGEATIRVGAVHSCAWYISGEPIGQRYLYFYQPYNLDERFTGDLWECGYNGSIFRLNEEGDQVEYGYTRRGGNTNVGLRYRSFRPLFTTNVCALQAGGQQQVPSPLRHLRLGHNLGSGQVSLEVSEGSFPEIDRITYYRADGVMVGELPVVESAGITLDLHRLPAGFVFVVVWRGSYRKALAYVKASN